VTVAGPVRTAGGAARPRIRLRPAQPDDIRVLDLWSSQRRIYQGEFNDLGQPVKTGAEYVAEPAVTGTGGFLMIELAEEREAIGTVSWHLVSYGPNAESQAVNFGIALVPEARGRGLGADAQRLLVEYLFATTPVHRVEASTDIENVPEQRALEKAGLRREGVLRGAQYRDGRWRDLVVYARLRTDL
jgi:RimJ/RimL family protein N-acetyltransferase